LPATATDRLLSTCRNHARIDACSLAMYVWKTINQSSTSASSIERTRCLWMWSVVVHISATRSPTVNASITILISLSDHLINLIICQLLANGCHDMAKLSSRDESVVVTIKDLSERHSQPQISTSAARLGMHQPTLNASLISSSESVSFIFLAIIVRNSGMY
jgi:hypothetical protein